MPRSRSERQRTRTLTGCYTCRERKIKCDDARPACRRCIALGVECQGYEVKLSLHAYHPGCTRVKDTDVEARRRNRSAKARKNDPTEPNIRRRPLFTDRERLNMIDDMQTPFFTANQDENLDRALEDIDTYGGDLHEGAQSVQTVGPFGVYVLESDPVHVEPLPPSSADMQSPSTRETQPSPGIAQSDSIPLVSLDTAVGIEASPMSWLARLEEITLPWLDSTNDSLGPTIAEQFVHPGSEGAGQVGNVNFTDRTSAVTGLNHASAYVNGFAAPFYDRQSLLDVPASDEGGFTPAPVHSHWPGYSASGGVPRSLSNMENISRIPGEARFLLEYYSTEVVNFMSPLPNPQSPWRTIHFPCAMSTMADLLVFGSTNNARMALFYALLSISANHLGSKIPWSAQLGRRSQDAARESGSSSLLDLNDSGGMTNYWLAKGSSFQGMATAQIRSCLQLHRRNCDDDEVYRELLMSLLSMVTISVTSGKLNSAHIYLRRARKLIEMFVTRPHDSSFKSSKIAALHQIYSYLQIIYNSTHVSRVPLSSRTHYEDLAEQVHEGDMEDFPAVVVDPILPAPLETRLDSLAQHKDDYQLFAKIYGVPQSLLTLISRASALAKELEEEEGTLNGSSPSSYSSRPQCQLLEDQICNWELMDDELGPVQSSSTYDPQVGFHLVQAMHDALVVMFFRRVRPISRMVLQHYVESAADHLNDHEEVKSRNGINAPALLWPWFMVASEAIRDSVREKLLLWSSLARQYGGRNIEIAEQVVTEVWRRHDLKLPNSTWVDVVREWNVTLVLT